jgi:hypothetical protein
MNKLFLKKQRFNLKIDNNLFRHFLRLVNGIEKNFHVLLHVKVQPQQTKSVEIDIVTATAELMDLILHVLSCKC